MSSAANPYTRLPGRAWSLFGAATLWLAADHALQVRLRGYTEVYRRFYFRDLQSLTLRPTRGYLGWTLALGLPALLGGAAALADLVPAWEFWAVVAGIFAAPLLVHLVRGATCRCHATTPLGSTELVALSRIRTARRSLARIRAEVEAVQETLVAPLPGDPEDVTAAGGLAALYPAPMPALPAVPSPGPPALPSRHPLRWHRVLVALLAADTVLSAAQASSDFRALDFLGILFAVAEVAVALGAIVAQGRSHLGRPALRRFPWAALAYIGGLTVVAWVAGMFWAFDQASSGTAPAAPFAMPPMQSLELVAVVGYLALALWGWLVLRPISREPVE